MCMILSWNESAVACMYVKTHVIYMNVKNVITCTTDVNTDQGTRVSNVCLFGHLLPISLKRLPILS